jgi:hypothetical protein
MTIKIHKISKTDLSKDMVMNVELAGLSNSSGMIISHFAYSSKQTEATIPYAIEIVREFVPQVDIDFSVIIRKKIDLTAIGPDSRIIEGDGKDLGEYNYVDSVPHRPSDLPPGFTEWYKG